MKTYIFITGATSGIGLGLVKRLSKKNNLVIHGRNHDLLKNIVNEVGENHLYWCYDLYNIENLKKTLKEFILEHKILIEKFIHCVGIDNTIPSKSLDFKTIENLMKINFYSAVEIINLLLKRSINQNVLNNILFISSISSIKTYKAKGAYSASKSALDSYMKVLSLELAPKIRVNSILPGAVETNMSSHLFSDKKMLEHFKKIYPLGIGEIENIVDLIEFYLSDKSSWVTGQQVVVDGGHTV